jgi:hypothetical protein
MEAEQRWRWVYRDPATGRIRTDGHMTEDEASRFPDAVRIPDRGRYASDGALNFRETNPGHFPSNHAPRD